MATFRTAEPDTWRLKLAFGLLLFDGFTGLQRLAGEISVSLANRPQRRPFMPFRKSAEATFLFFELPAGAYTFQVRSNENAVDRKPPYYQPVDLLISIPMPTIRWPAFPDISLADPDKPLDDPSQTAPYRQQRERATLRPTTAYPFPSDATLVRGTVTDWNGTELQGAEVKLVGHPAEYVTSEHGEFVFFFHSASGMGESVTLEARHSLFSPKQQTVKVQRGMTTTTEIVLVP
jgi:hypothetical protein